LKINSSNINLLFSRAVANPEKVRTVPVFWSGKRHCAIGEKQVRLAFPASFSLLLSFGGAKESKRKNQ
jgi:hypothetical protein